MSTNPIFDALARTPKRLSDIDRERILRNAIRRMHPKLKRNAPLWATVRDLCSVGSTSATEICISIGWNPHEYTHVFESKNL